MRRILLLFGLVVLVAGTVHAQDNYEIQVYGSETVPPKTTMVELHSNYTISGFKTYQEGVAPDNHAEHETVEITTGLNDWAEVGFYIFTSSRDGMGLQWVGDHIRPRVRVPPSWHWPVGVSISNEIGYQRALFSTDTWTWQINPIVDQQTGRWYWSINTILNRSWHGQSVNQGVTFNPAAKISYDITKKVAAGVEYYANYGQLGDFLPLHDQQQQIFPVVDLYVSPKWEFNFGAGIGPTASTEHWIVKAIVGRYFSWGRTKATD
ncbi:MAG TPA: hypothetical protein VHX63_15795 [Acidobacteriaceae bacterium]|jgi:hypothetical protein|nr:hypothetical protein [Acidobacteriaceae bacterium]